MLFLNRSGFIVVTTLPLGDRITFTPYTPQITSPFYHLPLSYSLYLGTHLSILRDSCLSLVLPHRVRWLPVGIWKRPFNIKSPRKISSLSYFTLFFIVPESKIRLDRLRSSFYKVISLMSYVLGPLSGRRWGYVTPDSLRYVFLTCVF